MQTKFVLAQCDSDGDAVNYGTVYEFNSLDACFDFLASQGHRIESAELINRANVSGLQIAGIKPARDLSVMYQDTTDFSTQANAIILENVSFYHIKQTEGDNDVSFAEFERIRNQWANRNIARKVFHPGNSLTLAFLLIGVGLALGAACPPALIFVALGVAAFSAVSALVYGIRWLSRDYNLYKAKVAANSPEVIDRVRKDAYSLYATEEKTKNYFSYCIDRLGKWAGEHKGQAIVMGIGFALFVTAVVVTALAFTGGLATVPILAGVIGGMGASGTALGAVGAVFGGALGSSAIATTLASIFAGATLILAPVNILDTIRRFVSGVYERKDSLTVVPPQVITPPPPPAFIPGPPGVIPGSLSDQLNQQRVNLKPTMTNAELELEARKAKYSDVLHKKDKEPEEEEKVHHTTKKFKHSGGYESD